METVHNLKSDSIRDVWQNKKRPDMPTITKENQKIDLNTIEDEISHLITCNLLENKPSIDQYSVYLKLSRIRSVRVVGHT